MKIVSELPLIKLHKQLPQLKRREQEKKSASLSVGKVCAPLIPLLVFAKTISSFVSVTSKRNYTTVATLLPPTYSLIPVQIMEKRQTSILFESASGQPFIWRKKAQNILSPPHALIEFLSHSLGRGQYLSGREN